MGVPVDLSGVPVICGVPAEFRRNVLPSTPDPPPPHVVYMVTTVPAYVPAMAVIPAYVSTPPDPVSAAGEGKSETMTQ